MRRIVRLLKVVGDENRLRILKLLQTRDMCVCEIQHILGLSQPAVSHHLRTLSNQGLVDSTKEGLFINYRLALDRLPEGERKILQCILESLVGSEQVERDRDLALKITREEVTGKK